jgi:hypothetical protein
MIDNFQDMYSRYHDREVKHREHIPSNNAAIYTSIARHLGLEFDINKYIECYLKRRLHSNEYVKINRNPNKLTPPYSKDELTGDFSLIALPSYDDLKASYFSINNDPNFIPKPLYKLNWFKVIKELWQLRDKHRNEVWENSHLYPNAIHLAFRLPPDYTYYIQQLSYNRGLIDEKPNLIHQLYFYIATYISLRSNRTSTKNIRWVILKDLEMEDSFLYDMIDIKAQIRDYFGDNHIFSKKVYENEI